MNEAERESAPLFSLIVDRSPLIVGGPQPGSAEKS
jgi:hypothetical protein